MPSAIIPSRKHDLIGNDYTFLERACGLDECRNHWCWAAAKSMPRLNCRSKRLVAFQETEPSSASARYPHAIATFITALR
jgi:hypothetical protein